MAKSKMDVIISPKFFGKIVFNHFTSLERALGKGVKIRLLTEKNKTGTPPNNVQVLAKSRFFRLKYFPASVPVTMMLFDDKEVNICISTGMVPSLWSNNPEIVKLTTSYFSDLWNRA